MSRLFELEQAPSLEIQGHNERFPVRRIYCVGCNYADHAREMGGDPVREPPFFFTKPASAVVANHAVMAYPARTADLHHEVELVVALDQPACQVSAAQAAHCIYGYAVGNDLTRRDLQSRAKKMGRPWDTAKGFDASAPIAALRRRSDIGQLCSGEISLRVNGEVRQQGDLSRMIWSVEEVIAELSHFFSLYPGDLVFTGTPAGVGAVRPGDVMEGCIEGLATLVTTIADDSRQ